MAIIKCKMCGGDIEISADKTFGTCEFCGSSMTLPKVDDDQRAAQFNRGNHFRRMGEFDKALAVYERIVTEDDTDAEAHWCCALCRFGIEYVEDPNTYEFLPTCHRVSFDSFLEDVDYLAALENSAGITRRQYQKDAAKIAEVQRGILAASQNEEPFDVFICYKESDENGQRTRDSLLAQEIYYRLTETGRRVFFARITLEDKAGSLYEPYIFAALNSARVMVAVGTKPEYFNAVWVKNEWSRFLAMMRKDRSKLLLPCYRDMDPYDLPEQLSVLQSYDMSKIGFIQDLIRGINKVLDADKKPEPVKETVIVQQAAAQSSANWQSLLNRGAMALDDGDWNAAKDFYDQVLNMDSGCAAAYLGLTMYEAKAHDRNELLAFCYENQDFLTESKFFRRVRQFAEGEIAEFAAAAEKKREDGIRARALAKERDIARLAAVRKKLQFYRQVIAAGRSHTVGLKSDGTVVAAGSNKYGQCDVSGWRDIVSIAAGNDHTVGLKSDGTVVAAGSNEYGKCDVSGWRDIVSIAASRHHTVGLKSDGTVVVAGSNESGQCDVSGWADVVSIAAGSDYVDSHTVGLKSDGTVVAAGYNKYGQCNVSGWTDIVSIAAGEDHTVGLKADGTVVAAGSNTYGQCNVSGWHLCDQETDSREILLCRIRVKRFQDEVDESRKKIHELEAEVSELNQDKETLAIQIPELKQQKAALEAELAGIRGLFTGKKKAEVQAKIDAVQNQIPDSENRLSEILKRIPMRMSMIEDRKKGLEAAQQNLEIAQAELRAAQAGRTEGEK